MSETKELKRKVKQDYNKMKVENPAKFNQERNDLVKHLANSPVPEWGAVSVKILS